MLLRAVVVGMDALVCISRESLVSFTFAETHRDAHLWLAFAGKSNVFIYIVDIENGSHVAESFDESLCSLCYCVKLCRNANICLGAA